MTLACVVLAGGRGTRMRPFTDSMPKALVPVLDQPFAHWQLRWLRSEGIEDVVYCIGHQGARVRDYIGDGSPWDVRVTYVDEGEELRGTGGALRLAFDQEALPGKFFLLYGDSYLPVDFASVESMWRSSGMPALMTVMRNEERWDSSNVIFQDGRVVLYDKARPSARVGEMRWIDYGLSVLTNSVVAEAVPAGAKYDLADVLKELSLSGRLAGLEVAHRFYEVGSAQGVHDLEEYLGLR